MQKLVKKSVSEIDFHNYNGAAININKAIRLGSKYSDAHPYQLVDHVKKAHPVSSQQTADANEAKKFCKNAVSELDFSNLNGSIDQLAKAVQLCHKY